LITQSRGAPVKREVIIREVGPREGFQSFAPVVETARKVALIEALVDARLPSIEVTSFVHPDRVPQLADAEEVVVALPEWSDGEFTALYLNRPGLKRAVASGRLRVRGWMLTSPSDQFLQRNSNTTCAASVAAVNGWMDAFRAHGVELHGLMVSTAFGCALAGPVAPQQVVDLVERFQRECVSWGGVLREVCLADTVGVAHPAGVRETVRLVRQLGVTPSLHLHDTYGLGLANAYAGFLEGVTIFESSIGGVGGCPFTPGASGNVATEELVYLFESIGVATGVDFERCCDAAAVARKVFGDPGVQPGAVSPSPQTRGERLRAVYRWGKGARKGVR
jgi:hydroxymethylglutaryl-CoA lyase